ncbi:MAG: class 1 fructose-bisphosphatase [Polyangiaceae bacterium]
MSLRDSMPPGSWAPGPDKGEGSTLETFIIEGQLRVPGASGVFTSLLNQIALATKLITSRVRSAGLADILGYTGQTNIQGEQVQKLDQLANDTLRAVLSRRGHCAALCSEEMDDIEIINSDPGAKYIVLFDPLDGSSNINVNVSIGTIFSIMRKRGEGGLPANRGDFLRAGRDILCAGYVIYGSSTQLVLSTGRGVNGFTYDPEIGEFFLSHPDIRIADRGNIYSINEGNSIHWDDPVRKWADWIKQDDKASGRPYTQRYVGTLVADAHRTLLKGGIFSYPGDKKSPNGKLRLLYEAAPMAFLFEAAGGVATDGERRILDIEPTDLHQRTPLVIGSREDVEDYQSFMRRER